MSGEYAHRDVVRVLDYQQVVATRGERIARHLMTDYRRFQETVPYTPEERAEVERLNAEQEQAIIDYHDHGKDIGLSVVLDRIKRARRSITRAAWSRAET